ncbi:hypothetical protein TrST_g11984 [Triparma strigata]|uniref:Nudix hydrolase domain-containing protein n=1 Tax=Triparma strigata TaxID=1606541 RepID=A0A9W7AHR0_9STRA|nr:hypothetical protein TrST_g11984 [Triparma strigata]
MLSQAQSLFSQMTSQLMPHLNSCSSLLKVAYFLLVLSPIILAAEWWRKGRGKKWEDASQYEFMQKDTVILVSPDDKVIGSSSKVTSHTFSKSTPRGQLHRAFSVFLFDSSGRLLLQKRASSKITFPDVWTNTCCSHPLHGLTPSEVDGPSDLPSVPGVKNAAVRKLSQELGMPIGQISKSRLKFLTRLHYWASDSVTHGPLSPWGEHEIDYVLFYQLKPSEVITINPNPEEVSEIKWVTPTELKNSLKTGLWSPWFRIITSRWLLPLWWTDLSTLMTTSKYVDTKTITTFDPTEEHAGGGGKAKRVYLKEVVRNVSGGEGGKKQGGYGKVVIHKESKFSQVVRFDEMLSGFRLLYSRPLTSNLGDKMLVERFDVDDLKWCDEMLGKVSRSFAAVIRQLPGGLLVDVMVFYLVLRALDTVEDDMEFFDGNEKKVECLKEFCERAFDDEDFVIEGCGEGDERRLLEDFKHVRGVFKDLGAGSQRVIRDITERMAGGMAEFVGKDLGEGTRDIKEYNRYCHFVAGLVGEGLSRLFSTSGLEAPHLASQIHLSDQMGLFLQKTNIIRDYLEDFVDGRAFWPQTIWKKYAGEEGLGAFRTDKVQGLKCLNELVTDALELAPDCLAYLSQLRCSEVFRFCAIPQVMAIATLDKVYNNPDVFTGVVKIRKGLSCKLILNTVDHEGVHECFGRMALSIIKQARVEDPNYERTVKACNTILEIVGQPKVGISFGAKMQVLNVLACTGLFSSGKVLLTSYEGGNWDGRMLPNLTDHGDVAALAVFFACVGFLICFMMVGEVFEGMEGDGGKGMKRSSSAISRTLVEASKLVE